MGGVCFIWFYFPSIISYYKLKLSNKKFRSARIRNFHFTPIPMAEYLTNYAKSRIQIDMEDVNQNGLTIRTIEALGAKKKLITTNQYVKEYDFFNENNILIVDRYNPIIPTEFLNAAWSEIPVEIYKKYSINSWLNIILA